MMKLPTIILKISSYLKSKNAKAIVVGGSVRDYFLNLEIKDYDIEVYGLASIEELESILKCFGKVNLVGKSFGILKFVYQNEEYDFSMPRRERKNGVGHRAFEVTCDGELSFKEASKRRDFTINAMGYDIEEKMFLDPFEGMSDLKQKRLKHINDDTFMEDSLRIYRAVQFCARFGYSLDKATFNLCKRMIEQGAIEDLPKERIYQEWTKMLLKSTKPSIGFELMRELGILRYFPELQSLIGVVQSIDYHPEGDVWIHTMMAIDKMVELKTGEDMLDLKLMFAVLCHDFGKPKFTQINKDGKITAIGHELGGVEPTKNFLYRLSNNHDFINSILPLIEFHLAPSSFYRSNASKGAIRRLSTKVNISELVIVAKADFLGRTTLESKSGIYKAGEWISTIAKELDIIDKAPIPLLLGRDLISLGLKPSKEFKNLLSKVYDKQLEGDITTKDEAMSHVQKLLIDIHI
ncbi:MAG: HD domain-containing protein [Epsilonproteobacteria bacterium]|nr:HD domain-containing protein [Campylobacterota bacterium]